MVASMDIVMAVETRPCKKLVLPCGRRTLKGMELGIGVDGMSSLVVTALTKQRSLPHEKPGMIASVTFMAVQTVFGYRWVLPGIGSPFLRVALVTEVVDRIGLDQLRASTAVGIVAAQALDSAFDDGMVGLLIDLRSYVLMAGKAQIRLSGFQELFQALVDRMAIVARNAGDLMPAHIPEGQGFCHLMASQTSGSPLLGPDFPSEGEDGHASPSSFLRMLGTGPVT